MSDRQTDRVQHGEIHDDTARSLATMLFAGFFIGFSSAVLVVKYELATFNRPLAIGAIGICGGVLAAYLALKTLPDARTIAAQVEEREHFNE